MISPERRDNRIVFTFPHHVDTLYCKENGAQIQLSAQEPGIIVEFDMQGVDYVCSSFLRICIETSRQVGRERLSLTHCTPGTKKVFKIAGYEQLMTVE